MEMNSTSPPSGFHSVAQKPQLKDDLKRNRDTNYDTESSNNCSFKNGKSIN